MIKKTVIYTGGFHFPDGDAGARRVLGVGKALREAGYDVVFGGWEEKERSCDIISGGGGEYQGFRYVSQNEFRTKPLSAIKRIIHHCKTGEKTLRWIDSFPPETIAGVILAGGYGFCCSRFLPFFREKRIPLIIDAMEWFEPFQCVGGPYGLFRWEVEASLRRLFPKAGNVIAISSFLQRHFESHGAHTVRIPPLVDFKETKWPGFIPSFERKTIRFAYAGSPARKDLLSVVIRAVCELRRQGIEAELEIVGPKMETVSRGLGSDSNLLVEHASAIRCHGVCEHVRALEIVRDSDATVLVRENLRYAHAGFSTKFVESMILGVPVISNATSDIAVCMRDGSEGLLLQGPELSQVVEGLRKFCKLTSAERSVMRKNSRDRGLELFDYRPYVKSLSEFMQGLKLIK